MRSAAAGWPQIVLHPAFGVPSTEVLAWTWVCFALASAGLVMLYKTTVADPGFLPCGAHPANGAKEVPHNIPVSVFSLLSHRFEAHAGAFILCPDPSKQWSCHEVLWGASPFLL